MHDLKKAAEPGADEAQAFADGCTAGAERDKIANTLMGAPGLRFEPGALVGPMRTRSKRGLTELPGRRGAMLAGKDKREKGKIEREFRGAAGVGFGCNRNSRPAAANGIRSRRTWLER